MRLDYALYGLAVVLFILSGLFFVFIKENEGQLVYVASTAVLGILSIGAGLAQRPKPTAGVSPEAVPTPPAPPPEPSPPTTAPVTGTEPSAASASTTAIEPSPVTLPAVEAPPPVPAPIIQPEPAPTPDVAPATSTESKSELLQIRGINESRVAQLNSNGIISIQDLANASADDLASKLGVSPKIVKMWVGSAKKMAK